MRRVAPAAERLLNVALVGWSLLLVLAMQMRWLEFGSLRGGWWYPYVRSETPPVLAFVVLLVALTAAARASMRVIDRHEAAVVAAWLPLALVAQLYLYSFAPFALERVIESDGSNSFYTAAHAHRPMELLSRFVAIAPSLPLHARTNMPGKILLYHGLMLLTDSPRHLGWLLLAVSNLGGLLLYLNARKLFADARTALYSLVLYLFMPAKLFFLPTPNTISPLPLFLALLLLLHYLDTGRVAFLYGLGAVVYLALLFELTPLAMGVLPVALLGREWVRGRLPPRALVWIPAHVAAGFVLVYATAHSLTGFDLFPALRYVLGDALDFNRRMNRDYGIWVVQNLKEFLLNAGLSQSILFLVVLARTMLTVRLQRRRLEAVLLDTGSVLVLSVAVVLLVLDVLGVNRGEVTRLWIFLAAFVQLIAAHECANRLGARTFEIVLGTTLLQSVTAISQVAFVMP